MHTTRPSFVRTGDFPSLDQARDRLDPKDPAAPIMIAVSAPSGSGKLDTVLGWLQTRHDAGRVLVANGDKEAHGYLAGLLPLVEDALTAAEAHAPERVAAAEQSLKRLLPHRDSPAYRVPKDLTGRATRDERTRFYHFEYQSKLLNGLYEFLLDHLASTGGHTTLVVDNAHRLPPTVLSFIDILLRRRELSRHLSLVLLTDAEVDLRWQEHAAAVHLRPLGERDAEEMVRAWGRTLPAPRLSRQRWLLAQGLPARLAALYRCADEKVDLPGYLSFETHLDLCLGQLDERTRYEMLTAYVAGHCTDDDPLAVRNYETFDAGTRERLHRAEISRLAGTPEEIFHPVHHLRLTHTADQVTSLAGLSISLQEIGLYDTWFDLFSPYWVDSQLRTLPGGGEQHNLAYLRMAFVLYSLGLADLSIRYLETFYHHFPRSLFTPTVLYSQSMAHGRYQSPPDLDTAERYALLNLEKIGSEFRDHPKHEYIRVFAENALAYIRARQGRMAEALQLCTDGLKRMKDIYGDDRYSLHQSILVYNTAQIYELTGDFEAARETYLQTIELDPYYGEYANDFANLLQNFGHLDEALEHYARAIELCPPYYEAYLNRSNLFLRRGDTASAERDCLRVVELMPSEARAHLTLGVIRLERGDAQGALEAFDAAIYHQPGNAQAWNNRGLAISALGDEAAAEESLRRAVSISPRMHEAWNNLGQVLYGAARVEESLAALDEAVRLADDPDYRYNRAVARIDLRQWDPAVEDIDAAERLGADPADVEELRERHRTARAAADA